MVWTLDFKELRPPNCAIQKICGEGVCEAYSPTLCQPCRPYWTLNSETLIEVSVGLAAKESFRGSLNELYQQLCRHSLVRLKVTDSRLLAWRIDPVALCRCLGLLVDDFDEQSSLLWIPELTLKLS